jgi:hypothetical protein
MPMRGRSITLDVRALTCDDDTRRDQATRSRVRVNGSQVAGLDPLLN